MQHGGRSLVTYLLPMYSCIMYMIINRIYRITLFGSSVYYSKMASETVIIYRYLFICVQILGTVS